MKNNSKGVGQEFNLPCFEVYCFIGSQPANANISETGVVSIVLLNVLLSRTVCRKAVHFFVRLFLLLFIHLFFNLALSNPNP